MFTYMYSDNTTQYVVGVHEMVIFPISEAMYLHVILHGSNHYGSEPILQCLFLKVYAFAYVQLRLYRLSSCMFTLCE